MYGFPEPEVIPTEVFATLPEGRRKPVPASVTRASGKGTVLEGPAFDRAGNLWITDLPNGCILRIAPDGMVALVVEYDGEPNGLAIHADGRVFVADFRHGLMVLDPTTGGIAPLCTGPEKERFKGVNDLTFAANGDLYFTDQGGTGLHDPSGRVYRLGAEGRLDVLIDTMPSPNGLALNAAGNILYVAATRSAEVWQLPLGPRGAVFKAGLFARLPVQGPDGMALDTAGNLAVANPWLGIVWLFDGRGVPVARIESCAGSFVTNVAFGGEDNRWLYICEGESHSVLRARMPHPGLPLPSHY